MPRTRNRANAWMAEMPGLYQRGETYVLRRAGSQTKLGKTSDSRLAIIAAYLKATTAPPAQQALRDVLQLYTASAQFLKLARSTQADALKAYGVVAKTLTKAGKPFGDVPAADVTIVVVRKYMDKRGETSETRADRELAYMSMAFTWAVERGEMTTNPCMGIRRFNPPARTRYVTDAEFAERLALAREFDRRDVVAAMQFAYLCRLRESEIVKLRESDVLPDGLLARRGKGSKTQVIEWTEELAAAVELARGIVRRVATPHLLVSVHSGLPMTVRSLQDAWNKLRKVAMERGQAVDYTFHDLKAKGVTDAPGDKHLASGHKTQRMTAVYDRLPGKAPATK